MVMCVADPEEMRVRYAIDADGEKPRVVALLSLTLMRETP